MPAQLRHISINADDVERARGFYERVFGWSYQAWGPPEFYMTADAGVDGALHGRREIIPGARMLGVEATMEVGDLDSTTRAIEAAGGRIVRAPATIPTVGTLVEFEDSEGNLAGIMRYEAPDRTPPPKPGGPAPMRWFAINADDVDRAKSFYEGVFGWTYEPWGPPGFYTVRNAGRSFNGGLQGRRELKPGARMRGFEISLGVADFKATVKALETEGGHMLTQPAYLNGVGTLGYFEDPEGNLIGICQYETAQTSEWVERGR
jgi:predicted enzyme related to lactoylglutathione lyase